jgi:hypothetical protein
MKPPPTPSPNTPVWRAQPTSDWGWWGGCIAFVVLLMAIVGYGVTREPPRCIGWEPAPPVYRYKPDGYHPESRWRCVEWEAP